MKKLIQFSFLLLASLLFQTCREEEPGVAVKPGKVQFAFRASALDPSGGRALSELPEGATLFITLNHLYGPDYPDGVPFNDYLIEVPLLKFGEEYISTPLAVPPSEFRIIDFVITDADHHVIMVTPRAGSPLASLVEHPVSIPFSVVEGELTNLEVEVIPVEGHSPQDFGYDNFFTDQLPSEVFQLSVFIPLGNGDVQATGAQAYILYYSDTLYNAYLTAGVNTVEFPHSSFETYTLVLIEPGYKKYSRTFILSELLDELDGNPLSVTLTPAFTFMISPDSELAFQLNAIDPTFHGNLSIDWGDGTVDDSQFDSECSWCELQHAYTSSGPFFVSISGDLEKIEKFQLLYAQNLTDVSLQHLPELKHFFLAFTKTSPTIDFSHNPKLENLFFAEVTISSLDISHNVRLKSLGINFIPDFPTSSIDAIIHTLLQNVIQQDIHGGDLKIVEDWGSENAIGPPSAAAVTELHTLQDVYGWAILPEEF